jgi:hypothetical protein
MLLSWSKLEGYNQGGCQVFFQGYGGHSYFLGIKCLYEYNIQIQTIFIHFQNVCSAYDLFRNSSGVSA